MGLWTWMNDVAANLIYDERGVSEYRAAKERERREEIRREAEARREGELRAESRNDRSR